MKRIFLLMALLGMLFSNKTTAQVLYGKVVNQKGKAVPLATVTIKELELNYSTSEKGFFRITHLPLGNYTLIVSHLGYKSFVKKIEIKKGKNQIIARLTDSPIRLGQAIVTGTRIPAIAKNIAFPIETVNKKIITGSLFNSLPDLLDSKPGVTTARDGAWGAMVNIRGLSKQNLVYLIDGARIETSTNIAAGLSLFNLDNIEKIEIIKGGLSVLYGTSATGGIVNIISKQPRFKKSFYTEGNFDAGYRSVNNGTSAAFNLFAGSEKWKAKLSFGKRNAEDTKIPDGYLKNSGFKDYSYSIAFGLLPFKKVEMNAEFQYYKATDVGIPGGAAFPPTATASYPEASRKLFSFKTIFRNPFPFAKTISLNYYNQFIRRIVEIVPAAGKMVSPTSDHNTNGLSLKMSSTFGKHFLITGIDAWARSYEGIRTTENKIADVKIVDKPIPNSTFGSLGFFLNDEIFLSKKTRLNIGGRYDFIRIKNEAVNNPLYKIVKGKKITPPPIKDASFEEGTYHNKSFSGNVNLLYKCSKRIDLTLSLAHAFRSPSLEERFQYINLGGIIYLGNPELEPEQSNSVNTGVRFYGDNFSFRTNAFANFFNNLVIDGAVVKDSLYQKVNVGKARYYGFESEAEGKIGKLLLDVSLSYVKAYDIEQDKPLPQIPPLNAYVRVSYPIGNVAKAFIDGQFYADQNDVPADESRTPGYAVYNFEIHSKAFQVGSVKFNIHAGVENIFNKKYRNHLSTYRGINLTEPGRNIFAKLVIKW